MSIPVTTADRVPPSRATVLPVSIRPGMQPDEIALLALARDGDQDAFGELAGAHRAELRAHCYRMLGSVHDADDALQEALLRAWRSLSGFEGRSSVRSWLYAIATNAALDVARQRARRELPVGFGPAGSAGLDSSQADPLWLEPYPDQWLADDRASSPEARYEQRESVELAFVIALQYLPPLQRAVLLLREVAGFPTAEISRQLGDQRTRALVQRYADALERGDADTLISMLTQDATWSMPPEPAWFRGHEAIRGFLHGGPLRVQWRHRATRANGQLAVGCYLYDEALGQYEPWVIDVLTLEGDKIAAVTAFLAAEAASPERSDGQVGGAELFSRFALPAELGPAAARGIWC